MEYKEARKFAAALYDDNDLMTYRNGKRAITRLVMTADRIDRPEYGRTTTTMKQEASLTICCNRRS
jgi:hypothetical protein